MSTPQTKLDEVLAPILAHAKKVEATDPEKAKEIRRLAGETRIELAKLESVALSIGCDLT
jgi:hypothetical protein